MHNFAHLFLPFVHFHPFCISLCDKDSQNLIKGMVSWLSAESPPTYNATQLKLQQPSRRENVHRFRFSNFSNLVESRMKKQHTCDTYLSIYACVYLYVSLRDSEKWAPIYIRLRLLLMMISS